MEPTHLSSGLYRSHTITGGECVTNFLGVHPLPGVPIISNVFAHANHNGILIPLEDIMEKLTKDLFKDEKIGTSKKTQAGCIASSLAGVTIYCSTFGTPDTTDVGR